VKVGATAHFPSAVADFFNLFIQLNIVLFIFNLLPFPPLDGYRIIEDLVPNRARAKMTQYESYGSIIFFILVMIPTLSSYTIGPIFNYTVPYVLNGMNNFFYHLF
jgi:Zn-dependent protease